MQRNNNFSNGPLKQNKIEQKLINLMKFNKNYQEGLQLQNLNLNNKLLGLQTENFILAQTQLLQRKISLHKNQQILRYSQAQQSKIQQTIKTISTLQSHKNLYESRSWMQNNSLKRQVDLCHTNVHQMSVRLVGMQIQLTKQLQLKQGKIQELKNVIKMYEKQNKRLDEQNSQFKFQLLGRELDRKYTGIKQSNHKNGSGQKQNILAQDKKQERLKNSIQQLRQQLSERDQKIQLLNRDLRAKNKQIQQLAQNRAQRQNQMKDFLLKMRKNVLQQKNYKQKQSQQLICNIDQVLGLNQKTIPLIQHHDNHLDVFEIAKGEGIIASIITLRHGINKELFQVFVASLKEGEQNRSNSLNIFLSKWKTLEVSRIQPYVQGYLQAIESILAYYHLHKNKVKKDNKQLENNIKKIRKTIPIELLEQETQQLPHKLSIKSPQVFKTYASQKHRQKLQKNPDGRSQINLWVLSTVQFTNNQHSVHATNIKNNILYLFRLLTIQYRITYPPKMREKQYVIDQDIWSLLMHYIVIAIKGVIDSA